MIFRFSIIFFVRSRSEEISPAMHEIYTRIFVSSFKLIPNQKRLVRFYNVEQTPLPIKNDFFSPRFIFFLRFKHQTVVFFCKKTHSFWSSKASRALCRKKTPHIGGRHPVLYFYFYFYYILNCHFHFLPPYSPTQSH